VVSTPFEHVSVAATMRARFGIESLGARMDAAADLSACIDPALLAASVARPRDLPRVELAALHRQELMIAPPDADTAAALRAGRLTSALADPRSPEQRRSGWLRWAQELDAVRVRG
jgi:hypothetical protein